MLTLLIERWMTAVSAIAVSAVAEIARLAGSEGRTGWRLLLFRKGKRARRRKASRSGHWCLPKRMVSDAVAITSFAACQTSIGLIAALAAGTALAHDHSHPVNDAWLKEQRNADDQVCCNGEDVLSANDIEWDASGKYRVKIGSEWLDVPPWALVRGPNRMGRMLVWLGFVEGEPYVRCFMPGTLS
jgi:hypothetical protein